MKLKIYQVDAFTDQPFRGNPAAVCILPDKGDRYNEKWMAAIAQEMNLSETAFLHQEEDGFNLRWFTPATEVDLCGHATLASAHILYETGLIAPNDEIQFQTRSGELTAQKQGNEIELNFPSTPPEAVEMVPGLAEALGVNPEYMGQNRFDYLVRVGSEKDVREASPDFGKLKSLSVRGVMLTSKGESDQFDFISRFFAPGFGIDEDPVTGSAHCCLGPYWGEELGKDKMVAYQASPRGGVVRVKLSNDRVYLGGKAVTVMTGDFLV